MERTLLCLFFLFVVSSAAVVSQETHESRYRKLLLAVTGSAEAVDSARGDAADIRNQLEADGEREKRREEQSLEDNKYLREQSGSIKSLIDAIEALARRPRILLKETKK